MSPPLFNRDAWDRCGVCKVRSPLIDTHTMHEVKVFEMEGKSTNNIESSLFCFCSAMQANYRCDVHAVCKSFLQIDMLESLETESLSASPPNAMQECEGLSHHSSLPCLPVPSVRVGGAPPPASLAVSRVQEKGKSKCHATLR